MKIPFPKVITHTWYWHWKTPVKNVYLDCIKHVQDNIFTLQYDNGRWYVGYQHDNYFNEKLSTSNKSLSVAFSNLSKKLEIAYQSKIVKPNYDGSTFKIKTK